MPIDTAAKRRSASGVGHRIGGRGVTPDASEPAAWRQQAGWGYSGIPAGESAPEPGGGGAVLATFRVTPSGSPAAPQLYIGPDLNVHYRGARDEADDTYLNAGTCTFVVEDADGATVYSGACDYVTGSDGDYRGVIDGPTLAPELAEDAYYTVRLTFAQGDYDDERTLTLRAAYRGRS